MGGICYHKGLEKGLWFEIKCLEDIVASKKKQGKDASFEKGILKAYKKLTEREYNQRAESLEPV